MKSAIEKNKLLSMSLEALWRAEASDADLLTWLNGARAATTSRAIREEMDFLWDIHFVRVFGESPNNVLQEAA